MINPEDLKALQKLAHDMQDSRTVAFVGAGASRPSGYPLWAELLRNLRELLKEYAEPSAVELELERLPQEPRLEAERYTAALRKWRFDKDAISQALTHDGNLSGPNKIHQLLVGLPFNHFVTTNYDTLIQDACRLKLPPEECESRNGRDDEDFNTFLGQLADDSAKRSVLHLHGMLQRDMTLTLADYDAQYLQEVMLLRMFTIFATCRVVFVGTSLTDPDLMQVIRRAYHYGGKLVRHYAFCPKPAAGADPDRWGDMRALELRAREREETHGIRPIFYDVVASKRSELQDDHADLTERLAHLLELSEAARVGTVTTPAVPVTAAGGNVRPVRPASSAQLEVEHVKLKLRAAAKPIHVVTGLSSIRSSIVLRQVANDYRDLPADFRFQNVIWLSPKRLGRFPCARPDEQTPSQRPPRSLAHAVTGEIIRAIGEHKITATLDHGRNVEQLRNQLDAANPALIVFDDVPSLRKPCSGDEWASLGELLSRLEPPTAALMAQGASSGDRIRWAGAKAAMTKIPIATADDESWDIAETLSDVDNPVNLELLAALAVLATPATLENLAARLRKSPTDLERAATELADCGLIEGRIDGSGAPARFDIAAPVRAELLDRISTRPLRGSSRPLRIAFREATTYLVRWAHRTLRGLDHWQHDNAQYERLIELLPDLMTSFEAACWIVADGQRWEAKSNRVPLGISLTAVLYHMARWGEAEGYSDYLLHAARGDAKSLAEARLMRSRLWSLAATDDGHLQEADNLARKVQRSGERLNTELGTDLSRQARIRRGVVQMKRDEPAAAATTLQAVWTEIGTDIDAKPIPSAIEAGAAGTAVDAGGWLAEAKLALLPPLVSPPDENGSQKLTVDEQNRLRTLLNILDIRTHLLERTNSQRERGHNWRIRGDVLLHFGKYASARRYFARALLVSFEFRDRLLEAKSGLGLAICDHRFGLAQRSIDNLDALRLIKAATRGRHALSLMHREAKVDSVPNAVLVVGDKKSGKRTAVETVTAYLTSHGFDPWNISTDLQGYKDAPKTYPLHRTIVDKAKEAAGSTGTARPAILIARVDVPNPRIMMDAQREVDALRQSLFLHMNPQRRPDRRDFVPASALVGTRRRVQKAPDNYRRWDSWLETRDISYVEVNSNMPIVEVEEEIRRVLGHSFLAPADLKRENRTWASRKRD